MIEILKKSRGKKLFLRDTEKNVVYKNRIIYRTTDPGEVKMFKNWDNYDYKFHFYTKHKEETFLIITHGSRDGKLTDDENLLKFIEDNNQTLGYKILIICCHSAKVYKRYRGYLTRNNFIASSTKNLFYSYFEHPDNTKEVIISEVVKNG